MRQLEHQERNQRPMNVGEASTSGLDAAAAAAASIAAASESVTERLLSGRSQAFLDATEQHGGQ